MPQHHHHLFLLLVLGLVSWSPLCASASRINAHSYADDQQQHQNEQVVAGITITTPPYASSTGLGNAASCENPLYKRSDAVAGAAPESCSYGSCGKDCLIQGAFCCNPGGSLAVEPQCTHNTPSRNPHPHPVPTKPPSLP